ncbi:Pentatricopeptide repeat-containing protein 7, mitochondrial [Schizosaccharomyces pombe]
MRNCVSPLLFAWTKHLRLREFKIPFPNRLVVRSLNQLSVHHEKVTGCRPRQASSDELHKYSKSASNEAFLSSFAENQLFHKCLPSSAGAVLSENDLMYIIRKVSEVYADNKTEKVTVPFDKHKNPFLIYVKKRFAECFDKNPDLCLIVYSKLEVETLAKITPIWINVAKKNKKEDFLVELCLRFLERFRSCNLTEQAILYQNFRENWWSNIKLPQNLQSLYVELCLVYHFHNSHLGMDSSTVSNLKRFCFSESLGHIFAPLRFQNQQLPLQHVYAFLFSIAYRDNQVDTAHFLYKQWSRAGMGPLPKDAFIKFVQLLSKNRNWVLMRDIVQLEEYNSYLLDHRIVSAFLKPLSEKGNYKDILSLISVWQHSVWRPSLAYLQVVYSFAMRALLVNRQYSSAFAFFWKIDPYIRNERLVSQMLQAASQLHYHDLILYVINTYYSGNIMKNLGNKDLICITQSSPPCNISGIKPGSLKLSPTTNTVLAKSICYWLNDAMALLFLLENQLNCKHSLFQRKSLIILLNGILNCPHSSYDLQFRAVSLLTGRIRLNVDFEVSVLASQLVFFVKHRDFKRTLITMKAISKLQKNFDVRIWNYWLVALIQQKLYSRAVKVYSKLISSSAVRNDTTRSLIRLIPKSYFKSYPLLKESETEKKTNSAL